jgi:hypothetical protein
MSDERQSLAADIPSLEKLHDTLAQQLAQAIQPQPILNRKGEVVGHEYNAASLNAAIRFLNDNGIRAKPITGSHLDKLNKSLPKYDDGDEEHPVH